MHFGLRTIALAAASLLALSSCSAESERAELPYSDQVGVQLFMWNWDSVAAECEFLAEQGVSWAMVSPPQEHIFGEQWWTMYQPVSYQLESRFGTREQFAAMVETCNSHNVDIIVDAIINHMANQDGIGFAGTQFSKYDYPGLYSPEDFNVCQITGDGQISNYSNREEVQICELVGLPDLDQSRPSVQAAILTYLNDLLSLGVAGFRFDAAKHMDAKDLEQIVGQLPEGTRVIHEVIRGNEPIQPEEYLGSGDVWEFSYAKAMKGYFTIERISPEGPEVRYIAHAPTEQAVAFISNHDTERNGDTLNYQDIKSFELATMLMLAEDYGQPMLYSSYAYDDKDAGPAQTPEGVLDASCSPESNGFVKAKDSYQANEWICQHRFETTAQMIKFRKAVSGTKVENIFQDGGLYGFNRGDKGYFMLNASQTATDIEVPLADGEYLNLLTGETLKAEGGKIRLLISPKSAVALVKN